MLKRAPVRYLTCQKGEPLHKKSLFFHPRHGLLILYQWRMMNHLHLHQMVMRGVLEAVWERMREG